MPYYNLPLRAPLSSIANSLAVSIIAAMLSASLHAAIRLDGAANAFLLDSVDPPRLNRTDGIFGRAPSVVAGNVSLAPDGVVFLRQDQPDEFAAPSLTVDGGSLLQAANGIFTGSNFLTPRNFSYITVTGDESKIEIGAAFDALTGPVSGYGNIFLRGAGDFIIEDGASVVWNADNTCDGNPIPGEPGSCNIYIGARDENNTDFPEDTNTGIVVIGDGSLLDASNTGGRLWVGFTPSADEVDELRNDFMVALNGGEIRSNEASIAIGQENEGVWTTGWGYVGAVAAAIGGTWSINDPSGPSTLDVGEGDGASGFVGIVSGGSMNITANDGDEAGFYLGQLPNGVPTRGGSNLLVISGAESILSVDDNLDEIGGSRIANGQLSIQDSGSLVLDSSLLVVSGKTGQAVLPFFATLATDPTQPFQLTDLPPAGRTLDVISGGTLRITDNDDQGISALIIGQTPDTGPIQEAHALVTGSIHVSNDPALPKIPLDETAFGIPIVSNIGTGSLEIGSGGLVEFENGDFVIGVNAEDSATVDVQSGGALTADRVVVGYADYEGAGPGGVDAETGRLSIFDGGVVNGDVIVDNNGVINGSININGALIGDGGEIDPGFSPGTIRAKSITLGPGTVLLLDVALNPDGTVNAALSDALVVSEEGGEIDLSSAEVSFELSSVDDTTSVDEILAGDPTLDVSSIFESSEEVVVGEYTLTAADGSISDEELEQRVEVVSFIKADCKKDGWKQLFRADGSPFKNQGVCIRYVSKGV